MTVPTTASQARQPLRFALLLLALVYGAVPTLAVVHQAHHSARALIDAARGSEQLVSHVHAANDLVGSCKLCQLAARSKQISRSGVQLFAFVPDGGSLLAVAYHQPTGSIPIALPSARAPPRV